MSKFKIGDRVRHTEGGPSGEGVVIDLTAGAIRVDWIEDAVLWHSLSVLEATKANLPDATDPGYYKFPGGAEVRQISAHLTSFGGQALQYVARSTRLDGNNKGDQVENLRKARLFLQWEIERIEAAR